MRLLIIEDEDELAAILAKGLKRHGYAVDVAANGERGWELAAVNTYDLLVLDLNLPDIDGLEICRRVRSCQPATLILILTARDQLANRVNGLDLGADDYMVKPFHFAELVARIRALLRRDLRVLSPLLCWQDLRLDPAARTLWQDRRRIELTSKEFGIIEYLLRHPGEVISQEALLEHVWGEAVNPTSNTVRVHIASLRHKLGDSAETSRYIETVVGQGYRVGSRPCFEEQSYAP